MANRKVLGRGLSALIQSSAERAPGPEASAAPLYVASSNIAPNPSQSFSVYGGTSLEQQLTWSSGLGISFLIEAVVL